MMKRTKKELLPSIGTLPEELLTEVLARVGSSAVTDLFNVKKSCKGFYKAGEDREVLRRVSLEKLPAVPWEDSYREFIRQCEDRGNPEALFKRGMVEYFSSKNQVLGIEFLKKATCLGHEEAAYMLGLILLCTNHPSKSQALEILKKLEQGSPSTKIQKWRKRSKEIIREMWTSTGSLPQPEPMCTSLFCKRNGSNSGWLSEEDVEPPSCEACKWDQEIFFIRNVLQAI
ncbi:putative F-box protein At1g67623 [Macadamia integrifolia]|uniref:putative F-box protein At1g67623 n=1 Tax=Macadamia integrifolia TaxID=60698 RepID=UPI001C4E2F60|nr:putative F-box protein At1g67623 [Macadamia integrifolia]